MEQLKRDGNKVSFELLMMKIDQIFIKVHNLLWKNYQKCITHSIYPDSIGLI